MFFMTSELRPLDQHTLQVIFIVQNKAFTQALRHKKPHAELVELYKNIQETYSQLKQLKPENKSEIPLFA